MKSDVKLRCDPIRNWHDMSHMNCGCHWSHRKCIGTMRFCRSKSIWMHCDAGEKSIKFAILFRCWHSISAAASTWLCCFRVSKCLHMKLWQFIKYGQTSGSDNSEQKSVPKFLFLTWLCACRLRWLPLSVSLSIYLTHHSNLSQKCVFVVAERSEYTRSPLIVSHMLVTEDNSAWISNEQRQRCMNLVQCSFR